jgi:YppG-like protein
MYGPMSNNFMSSKMRQQQTYPFIQGIYGPQPMNWDPYLNVVPSQNNPSLSYFAQPAQSVQGYQQIPMYQQHSNPSYAQAVFQNPLIQPKNQSVQKQQMNSSNGHPYMNPYPKASFLTKPPSGMKSVLNSFKSQDGSIDINKMVDTAGQMVNAVSQVSSVVKGFGGMFKA